MAESNPWALHGMAEHLLEVTGRSMWVDSQPSALNQLRKVLLETEGDLGGLPQVGLGL